MKEMFFLICFWHKKWSPVSHKYFCVSDTTTTDQSDIELRISALQEQLRQRKLEAEKLRREEKQLRKEKLRSKEQSLLKQLEVKRHLFKN